MTFPSATLYAGDSLRVLQSLESNSFGGLVTDPPYSSGGQFRSDRVGGVAKDKYLRAPDSFAADFCGDSRDQRSWITWCTLWLSECYRLVEPGGVFATFTDWRQLPALTDSVQCAGWTWRGIAAWDKTTIARPAPARPRAQAEYIVWGSKGPMSPARAAPCLPGVFTCPVDRGTRVHPTQKPLAMLRQLVQIVEREKPVLDPFMGSGSHGVASILEGHPFTGVELSPDYAEIARLNIEKSVGAHGLTVEHARALKSPSEPVQVTLF